MYPNGTVGNKGHVSIFLENKSEEPLHISEVRDGFKKSKWKFKMAFAIRGPTPPLIELVLLNG